MDFHSQEVVKFAIVIQYKSLKLDRNGGKSEKSKTIFVASPVEGLDAFCGMVPAKVILKPKETRVAVNYSE